MDGLELIKEAEKRLETSFLKRNIHHLWIFIHTQLLLFIACICMPVIEHGYLTGIIPQLQWYTAFFVLGSLSSGQLCTAETNICVPNMQLFAIEHHHQQRLNSIRCTKVIISVATRYPNYIHALFNDLRDGGNMPPGPGSVLWWLTFSALCGYKGARGGRKPGCVPTF